MRESNNEHRPRLSVLHLLVWVTLCAAFLGVTRSLLGAPDDGRLGNLQIAIHTAVSMVYGMALGYPLVRFVGRRTSVMPSHPGEFLWSAEAMLAAAGITRMLVNLSSLWMESWEYVAPMLVACVYLWTGARIGQARPWSRLCYLFAGLEAAAFLTTCVTSPALGFLPRMMARIVASIVLTSIVIGQRGRLRRPWTHWAGVVVFLGVGLCAMAYIVAFYYYTYLLTAGK